MARPPVSLALLLRWCMLGVTLVVLLLTGAVLAASWWLSGSDFKARVQAEASAALGSRVTFEALQLGVWPRPGIAAQGVVLHTSPPVSVGRVALQPRLAPLLQGRLEIATLRLQDASLPQAGIAAALQKWEQTSKERRRLQGDLPPKTGLTVALQRLELANVRLEAAGVASTLAGEVTLAADMLPATADLRATAGRWQGARLRLEAAPGGPASGTAQASAGTGTRTWQAMLTIGGGSMSGPLSLTRSAAAGAAPSAIGITARLQTRGVAIESLSMERSLSGKLDADTTLSATARDTDGLAQALRSQSRFSVRNATLHGLDLAKAIKTVGQSRGGQTALDTLTGELITQGQALQLRALDARSGLLAARGDVQVSAARQLSGRIAVDLAGGVVGVPLELGGTVAAPHVSLTRGGLLGAAAGTALLPGIGTGVGAKLGDKLGRLLGQ